MKTIAPAALAALADGSAIVTGAVAILTGDPLRVWGGYGTIEIDGESYQGVGDRGLAQISGGALGGAEQNLTLALSGVDPAIVDIVEAEALQWAPAVMHRLIFDGTGHNLLDAHVFRRGRLDEVLTEETIGGTATISAAIESAARGLGRKGGRMRTDADQRLVKPTDGSMKSVSYAAEKQLYWGGPRPAPAGAAIAGGAKPGGGSFVPDRA